MCLPKALWAMPAWHKCTNECNSVGWPRCSQLLQRWLHLAHPTLLLHALIRISFLNIARTNTYGYGIAKQTTETVKIRMSFSISCTSYCMLPLTTTATLWPGPWCCYCQGWGQIVFSWAVAIELASWLNDSLDQVMMRRLKMYLSGFASTPCP